MSINELLLSEFDEEAKKTRAMLERVPMKPDYRPHEKSMALGRLAAHVAGAAVRRFFFGHHFHVAAARTWTAEIPVRRPDN